MDKGRIQSPVLSENAQFWSSSVVWSRTRDAGDLGSITVLGKQWSSDHAINVHITQTLQPSLPRSSCLAQMDKRRIQLFLLSAQLWSSCHGSSALWSTTRNSGHLGSNPALGKQQSHDHQINVPIMLTLPEAHIIMEQALWPVVVWIEMLVQCEVRRNNAGCRAARASTSSSGSSCARSSTSRSGQVGNCAAPCK